MKIQYPNTHDDAIYVHLKHGDDIILCCFGSVYVIMY